MTAPLSPPPAPGSRAPRAIAELRSVAITGLFVLAVLYTLHLARDFLVPIVLALFLALLLRPVVRLLRRIHLPAAAASALVLACLLAGLGTSLYELWDPAAEWVARAPQDLQRLETKVRRLLRPVEGVTHAAAKVDEMTDVGGPDTPKVALRAPTLSETVFGGARDLLAGGLIVLVLGYFFLASGDQFLRKLPRVLARQRAERVLAAVQETEDQISRYLQAVTVINLALGTITGGVLALLGMPTPWLLGAVAAVLNFVPYFGPAVMFALLAMVGLISLDDPARALLPPLAFLGLHAVEANLVTPHVLGRRLPLNPTAIFVGLLFWLWIWGIAGALLAVPIMVTLKVACDRSESLAGVGEFLGR
jgi:predicted PurR-regulated permease PerM